MQVQKKLCCHWDLVRFVSEKHLQEDDGTFLTLSVTEGNKLELMIFLGKDDSNSGYEVRVYKNEPGDKYVPNENDKVSRYEENDEYALSYISANPEDYEDTKDYKIELIYER